MGRPVRPADGSAAEPGRADRPGSAGRGAAGWLVRGPSTAAGCPAGARSGWRAGRSGARGVRACRLVTEVLSGW